VFQFLTEDFAIKQVKVSKKSKQSMQGKWRQVQHNHDQLTPVRLLVLVTEFFTRKELPENKQTTNALLSEMHL